jgi:hypothetical protein
VPELDTRAGLARLWNHLKKSARHRVYPGWFDRWPDAEARAISLRWPRLSWHGGKTTQCGGLNGELMMCLNAAIRP